MSLDDAVALGDLLIARLEATETPMSNDVAIKLADEVLVTQFGE